MKLYEITDEYRAFIAAVESGDIPEEAIADTLEAIGGEFDKKIDSIVSLIKEKRRFAEAIKAEVDTLNKRLKAAEQKAKWLEDYISRALLAMGQEKFESPRHKISFRRSTAVRITDEAAFIKWATDNAPEALTAKIGISKAVVGELIEHTNIPFAAVEEKKNIQIN